MTNPLMGPTVEGFSVGAWCPSPDGSGKPTAVAITMKVKSVGDLVMRIKTPERVDEIIKLLTLYKEEVWPAYQNRNSLN